ncbi:unnamed protein product [Trifolium pratense]|uniref:Uncharacterized protein n=1 Tax=Trifolium pratense TaxID=57577 RepID=A0ACB0JFV9_TRIPR|nr:unnamed protein product [Trifolium pratense]
MSLFCHKYRHIIILCLILFASTNSFFTHLVFMAEGRPISNLNEVAKNGMEENGSMLVEKFQIGSRPPKCEKRCTSCVHCEAVQVPIVPSKVQIQRSHHYSEAKVTYSSRGDGLSNYKPISWKCKCGDYLFNP